MVGAAELRGVGDTCDEPAPAPAPARTPDTSAPCPPTERFASAAIVSLMLKPARGLAFRAGVSEPARVPGRAASAASFNLGSIMLSLQYHGCRPRRILTKKTVFFVFFFFV